VQFTLTRLIAQMCVQMQTAVSYAVHVLWLEANFSYVCKSPQLWCTHVHAGS